MFNKLFREYNQNILDSFYIPVILGVLLGVSVAMKIEKIIDYSWWIVLLPLYIEPLVIIIVIFFMFIHKKIYTKKDLDN